MKRIYSKDEIATRHALFNAKGRCHNRNHSHYRNYGARGITVDPLFMERKAGIQAFIDEVGIRPGSDFTLDRIDVNKGYEPGNLRWATRTEQQQNRRDECRKHRIDLGWGTSLYTDAKGRTMQKAVITDANGRSQTINEWAQELGLKKSTIVQRVDRNWPIEMILSPKKRP